MNENELQALWQSETSELPSAFTVSELDESSLRPLAEPAPFQPWVDGRSFLRKLLIARRDAQRFQLLWAVPALPFLLLLYAAERARWLLPVLLGILTVGIVLFVRQVGAVMVTGRAIRRLAPELTVVPGSPIAPPRRFSGWLLVAMALSTVAGVAGYVAVGNKRAVAQQRSRAMAECFDKGADLAFTAPPYP